MAEFRITITPKRGPEVFVRVNRDVVLQSSSITYEWAVGKTVTELQDWLSARRIPWRRFRWKDRKRDT